MGLKSRMRVNIITAIVSLVFAALVTPVIATNGEKRRAKENKKGGKSGKSGKSVRIRMQFQSMQINLLLILPSLF